MEWVVKLTEHGGQYRITLPRDLLKLAGFEGVEFVELHNIKVDTILIKEYHGKSKEKRDVPEGQA